MQLLLADGTTFTVGPNSSLVIDSFVYDPEAGTAQVAATLTKGVLRFIGAATSKTPDGVAITTPVGVVGIRGGVTDINMNPPAGIPPHISMIFGNSVTLTNGGQLLGRLFEAGYSLALIGGSIDTVKTPGRWASAIQQALSSKPGQTGGAPKSANNANVARHRRGQFLADRRSCRRSRCRRSIAADELGDQIVVDGRVRSASVRTSTAIPMVVADRNRHQRRRHGLHATNAGDHPIGDLDPAADRSVRHQWRRSPRSASMPTASRSRVSSR